MESFENTKSSITGSALGKALSMTSSTSWNDVINKIKGVSDRGVYQMTGGIGEGSDYISFNSIPVGYYGPSNGSWSPEIRAAKTNFGNASTGNVLSGVTFTSQNGLKISGTMANRGNLNWSGSNTTYSVPAGYYSGGTLNSKTSYNNGYNAGKSNKVSTLSVSEQQYSGVTTDKNKQGSFTVAANTGTHYVITTIVSRANSTASQFLHTATTTNGSISEMRQMLSDSHQCVKTWHLVKSNAGSASTITFTAGRGDAWLGFFCAKLT